MTYGFMAILLGLLAVTELYCASYSRDALKKSLMDRNDVNILKGIFCIVIALVHAPEGYGNKIQDLISSFGYIGVTFFFMASAYGLSYGVKKRKGYLHNFWIRRLPGLLIPVLLVNVVKFVKGSVLHVENAARVLYSIPNWVKILLLCYAVFWLVHIVFEKMHILRGQSMLIGIILAVLSLIGMFSPWKIMLLWPVEAWGFIYGLAVAETEQTIRQWMDHRWEWKSIIALAASLVSGVCYIKFKNVPFWGNYVVRIMLSFVLTGLILIVSRRVSLGNKISRMLGDISYFVYLMHATIYSIIEKTPIRNSGLFLLVSIFMTCAASYVLWMVNMWLNRTIPFLHRK